ncbi:MAG: response regulator [Bacteroidota bacterium]
MPYASNTSNSDVDILLVEDNHDEAELTIRSLRKIDSHSKLVHIDDGAEALDFIFARNKYSGRRLDHSPKMILLDLKLPKVNGLEILKQVKSNAQTKKTPVILLTSSREERDIEDGYLSGANSYVVKPNNFENYTKAISELGHYWMQLNAQ